jgi:outer membrane receptor protein involved in Fe transport
MNRRLCTILMLLASLTGYTSVSTAQERIAVRPSPERELKHADAVLARPVNVQVDRVSLGSAIKAIGTSAGITIGYRSDEISHYPAPVTLHVVGVPLRAALDQLLKATALRVVAVADGSIAVRRMTDDPMFEGVIVGTVTDARTKRPLAGATVLLDGATRGMTTDARGQFRLPNVTSGEHRMTARLLGYVKRSTAVQVTDNEVSHITFVLETSANTLDQVVVTGTVTATELKAVPNAITVITAKDLEDRNIRHIDQLFRGDVPGLFAAQRGTSGTKAGSLDVGQVVMFSRGTTMFESSSSPTLGATNAIKTYVDGVEMSDPRYLSQIDPASIERIEILAGPQASTIYGSNALNGVMQIFTKRGHSPRPQITAGWQSGFIENNVNSKAAPNHRATASLAGLTGAVSYNVGSSWDYTGSWTPSRLINMFSGFGGARAELKRLTLDVNAGQMMTVNKQSGVANWELVRIKQNGFAQPTGNSGVSAVTNTNVSTTSLGTTLTYTAIPWWSHQMTVGVSRNEAEAVDAVPARSTTSDSALQYSESKSVRTSQSYNTTIRVPLTSQAQLTLTGGGDHWRTKSSSLTASSGTSTGLTGSIVGTLLQRSKPEKNTGAYLQGQLALAHALFFTYGLRAEWNANYGNQAKVLPGRYGLSYVREIGSITTKLRGSYGRSTRPPTPTQKFAGSPIQSDATPFYGVVNQLLANPELGPEYQQGGEGGVELYFGNRGSLVVTRYNQTVDNLIQFVDAVDSSRALSPGFNGYICNPAFAQAFGALYDLRSDGYCYVRQAQFLNAGSIRNQGWELQGSTNLGPLSARATYSWTKSRVIGITARYRALATGADLQPGYTFNLLPEHTGAITVGYARGGESVSLTVNGVGRALRDAGNSTYFAAVRNGATRIRDIGGAIRILNTGPYRAVAPQYATTNLDVAHRFSRSMDLTLNVSNLTDHYQNDVSDLSPTPGRTTNIGIRVHR